MARIPLELDENEGWHVTPHGGFGKQRTKPSEGACGVKGTYPCTHWGVDLGAPAYTAVVAPERGEVWYSMAEPMLQPLRGYQPGAVLLKGVSGVWHVLGHLVNLEFGDHRANAVPQGGWAVVEEGTKLGEVSPVTMHTHWEVRATKFGGHADPAKWLAKAGNEHAAQELAMMSGVGQGKAGGGIGGLLVVGLLLYAASDGRR